MRKLIYGFSVSLDGYINDRDGSIDWTNPDEELHQFHNDRYREIEVSLHGRRLYELMAEYWPHVPEDAPRIEREFATLWTEKPKVVFSRTLTEVHWNSTLVSENAVEEVRRLKAGGSGVMEVGGASLAASLIPHGLIDEYQLFVLPVALGGGTPLFPPLDKRIQLRLVETRHFDTAVMLRYIAG
ncbi:dihydrofolate reductase [Streptomyces gardneri]|uniref:dihydrofolate reductase family protein n=1 Tax=Nocardia TaxID=1817 RepID=UPI00135708F0|nr:MULTISPECIES: dihydrofolate reductase family protein [Nocardia]MBF6168540.1 dihydrofolate reductase [Streptomyces gardneri]MBF6207802.1 dihydrofolate reductase [Streptomyces gardneri]UAK30261.1 dihydrofolate reductase family protein [Nocardia asteroides]